MTERAFVGRMTKAANYLDDAHLPESQLATDERLRCAIDAAYIALLEVAVRHGLDFDAIDPDAHPALEVIGLALDFVELPTHDAVLMTEYANLMHRRYLEPLDERLDIYQVQRWARRIVALVEHHLAAD